MSSGAGSGRNIFLLLAMVISGPFQRISSYLVQNLVLFS